MTISFLIILVTVIQWSNFYVLKETKFIHLIFSTLLFGLSIIIFVFSNNPFTCIVGWDGLGVTSFILIVYYNNWEVKHRGIFVLLANKIGDCFLIFAITSLVFVPTLGLGSYIVSLSCILLLIANCTKSAHLPFTEWLALSIAAPTTISALVHSRTLVCGGIILQIKFNLHESNNLRCLINLLSSSYAGIIALNEKDLKKLVAFRTISQTAFISFLFSLNIENILITHIISHAFFKRSIFIQIGNNIHSNSNNQNISIFNASYKHRLTNRAGLFINNITLLGLTFSRGFLAKDIVIEKIFSSNNNVLWSLLSLITIFLTIIYAIVIFKTVLIQFPSPFKSITTSAIRTMRWLFLSSLGLIISLCLVNNNLITPNFLSYKFIVFVMIYFFIFSRLFKNTSIVIKHASNSNILIFASSSLPLSLAFSGKLLDSTYDILYKQIFRARTLRRIFFLKRITKLSPSAWGMLVLIIIIFIIL